METHTDSMDYRAGRMGVCPYSVETSERSPEEVGCHPPRKSRPWGWGRVQEPCPRPVPSPTGRSKPGSEKHSPPFTLAGSLFLSASPLSPSTSSPTPSEVLRVLDTHPAPPSTVCGPGLEDAVTVVGYFYKSLYRRRVLGGLLVAKGGGKTTVILRRLSLHGFGPGTGPSSDRDP